MIEAGRVRVNGTARRDPEWPVSLQRDRVEVDEKPVHAEARVYLMLNKPRGLVTSLSDERGRATVLDCLAGLKLPFVSPVGRLDKASEGLLLFTNDTAWAARLTAPESEVEKVYHVQIDRVADNELARQLEMGTVVEGESLAARRVAVLRAGEQNSWLEMVLAEGKNRHIRRLLEALGINVLRLIRVAIGPLALGNLAKGQARELTDKEVAALEPGSLPGRLQAGR